MNYKKWFDFNTTSLAGKTALITGSTGGLGKEISLHLARLGCSMIFLNRNLEKSNEQKNNILSLYPNVKIDIITLNLEDFKEVITVTEKLKNLKFDFLIHNAGIYNVPLIKTETSFNNVFQTNFLSPYYITKELLPCLKKVKNSKVIVLSSIAYNYTKLNENDLDFSYCKKHSHIYGNSKRFLMFSLFELFKNEKNVKLSIVHPGITLTNITNHYPKSINWLVKIGIKLLFPNPKKASLNIIKGLFENTNYFEWIGPKYFNIWGNPQKKIITNISNEESEQIFKIAEDLYKKYLK